ncbi:MAG: hypothetical protein HQM16_01055 [Deltaproteobacteria bacterium]|nr:hypothetical protein [Deltaproteobacteria bacterium]
MNSAFLVQQIRHPGGVVEVLSVQAVNRDRMNAERVMLRNFPAQVSEFAPPSQAHFEEWLLRPASLEEPQRTFFNNKSLHTVQAWPGSEVRTLVNQGPVDRRVNLTIVGDGYTEAEKVKFFEDAQRLTREMFVGRAFASYLPLFNVHAVFVPSNESGITDRQKKDTALGLYRSPKGSKRAIMPGDSGAARRAVALAPRTDYPILLANDDYYGGLGGEFAITTRSLNSGSMVLNHELGHNISEVGEEYDGGQVYRGANFSRTTSVSWREWVDSSLKAEKGEALIGKYPWKNLSDGDLSYRFLMPQGDKKNVLVVDLSSVGWSSETDVEVLIDGQICAFDGIYTSDRSFFRLRETNHIKPGWHELVVRDKNHDGDNILASIRVTAYPADYDFTPKKVGAFPVFAEGEQFVGYRPTHESCLMRDMRSPDFCVVDKQSIWHNLLRRLNLIDGVTTTQTETGIRAVLSVPDLLGLSIQWYLKTGEGEQELTEYRNMKTWQRDGLHQGEFRVRVRFETSEVREYNQDFEDEAKFRVG